ncbi:DNA-methyltransferase [Tautonia plasticadhaerens]|uniref:Methyltransferase n=1 Tax=Tautonia plasticadhaerens TaxID=2527974 RepID=A0A518H7Y8_9BACT|nr:site-specific DNA-methyltransferase [Tautonia plasticadhaerens]QDV36977.1 DNA adenine methyltransferase YhdJ [Tautonia plasticadhaerens]
MNESDLSLIDRIVLGNCVEGMRTLPGDCIPLTVTSPPYDHVRAYGGHTFDDETFRSVAQELHRITMPGGVVAWVVADGIGDHSESCTSARQKLFFREVGFKVYHTMIMARSGSRWPARVRYGDSLEYAFILSKGRPRTVNLLRDKPNRQAGLVYTDAPRPLAQRERPLPSVKGRPISALGVRSAVWTYPAGGRTTTRDRYAFDHPALMPERMAEDHILSWSNPGDLLFDPFCGAATTCKMALLNHRRYLGFEINPQYHQIALRRMRDAHAEYRRRLDTDLLGA